MEDETLTYYRDQVATLVWSGFFNRDDLERYLDDLAYDEQAVPFIGQVRAHALSEMDAKRAAEAGWPAQTDWDRLAAAFVRLEAGRVLALHNAGYTTSDAHGDAWHIINTDRRDRWDGFCYYHGQDIERAIQREPLFVGFEAVAEGAAQKTAIGERVAAALRDAGFDVDWNGDPETRMSITDLDWKKRTDWRSAPQNDPPRKGLLSRLFGL